jgi:hypothetical protein
VEPESDGQEADGDGGEPEEAEVVASSGEASDSDGTNG